MKKTYFILPLFIIAAAVRAEGSQYNFSEENIAAYKQIYKSLTEDSHHLREAEKYSRKIEELEQRRDPKQQEYNQIKEETDELFENARHINQKIRDIDETLSKLSVATAREVLRVLLLLLTEAADAMTSTSVTDQVINYTKATINEVAAADEEQLPVLVEMIRRRREAEEARQEMREDIKKQRDRAGELMPRQHDLQDQIRQLEREIEVNVRNRDRHLQNHQNTLNRYLRTVPDELARAAEASEKEIDSSSRDLRSEVHKSEPDFSPFISHHEKLAEALTNSRITGEEFETRWEETSSQAQRHSRSADDAESDYQQYQRKVDEIRREVEAAKRIFLSKVNDLDRQILAINTNFISRFESNYQTRFNNIERVLQRRPDTEEPTLAQMGQLEETSQTLAQRYSDLSQFLQTANETFNRQFSDASNAFEEIFVERDMYLRAGENLAEYAGYSKPANLEEKEEEIQKGRDIVTEGPLSFSNRMEIMQKAADYEEKASFYPAQVQANEDYKSAAEAFISAAENFRPNSQEAAGFYGEEIREIKSLSGTLNTWKGYYRRFLEEGSATIPWLTKRRIQPVLHRYTLEDHIDNQAKTEDFLDAIRKYSHEYSILYGLYSELQRAKFNLQLPASDIQPLMDDEREAAKVYSIYEDFDGKAEDFIPFLEKYLEHIETLQEFKRKALADYKRCIDTYSSITRGYEASADKEAYAGQHFDQNGRSRELEVDGIINAYYNFVVPFQSQEISVKASEAQRALEEFFGLGGRVRRELFTGPEITGMRLGDKTFRGGFTRTRVAELSREDLTNDAIVLEGELQVHGEPVQKILVSKDGGMSYNYQAQLSGPSSFRYEFRPDAGVEYHINLMAVDERGNEGLRFPRGGAAAFLYTGYSYQESLESFFETLAESYRRQDPFMFMNNVSWNYLGRYENLERAVERDFENFDAIDMQFDVESVSLSPGRENATVRSRWRRSWTNVNTGERNRTEGENSFRLVNDEGEWKLLSYSGVPIFGLLVDLPIESPAAEGNIDSEPGLTIHRTQTLERYVDGDGFSFVQGKVVKHTGIGFEGDYVISYDGPNIQSMGFMRLEDVHSAPETGYDTDIEPAEVGYSYVVICENGNYAKFRITDMTFERIIFDWAYQSDGSRDLR